MTLQLVEIPYDLDILPPEKKLLHELGAQTLAVQLADFGLRPLLTPLRANTHYEPKNALVFNLCGPPASAQFGALKCAKILEARKRNFTGANSLAIQTSLQINHKWKPETSVPQLPITLITFFNGEPLAIETKKGWENIKKFPEIQKIAEETLTKFSQKTHCSLKKLYGLLTFIPNQTPHQPLPHPSLKLIHIQLNPPLYHSHPFLDSLIKNKVSYQTFVQTLLNEILKNPR